MRVILLAIALAACVGCEQEPRKCYKITAQDGKVYREFANRVYLGVASVGIHSAGNEDDRCDVWIYNPSSVETYWEYPRHVTPSPLATTEQ